MKKIRICFVLPSHWSQTMGGAEYQVKLIVEALVETGNFEIHYLCRNADFKQIEEGYSLHSVGSTNPLSKYAKFTDSKNLLQTLQSIDPDVVYQRNGGAYTGICAYYSKKNNKSFFWHLAHEKDISRINLFQSYNPAKIIDKLMLVYGIKNAKKIIAQSDEQVAMLDANFGKNADTVIPNFHPIPISKQKLSSPEFQILWVANFNPHKQPHLALELARRLESGPKIEITMVGRAPAGYSALVEDISKQKNIDYRGSLPIDEVNELFQTADIFINTSSKEGFPNSFIQAWMREVPVVSLRVNPDGVLTRESIGFCSSTIDQMELDVLKLIADRHERLAMGKRARQYAIKSHSTANIKNLIELLESTAEGLKI